MIGETLKDKNPMFSDHRITLVHKRLLKGERIPGHNHKDCDIFFTLIKGNVEVTLDNEETHILEAGNVLKFDGVHYISAEALIDSDIYVYLVKK